MAVTGKLPAYSAPALSIRFSAARQAAGSRRPRGRRGRASACRRGGASRRTVGGRRFPATCEGKNDSVHGGGLLGGPNCGVGAAWLSELHDVAQRVDGKANQGFEGFAHFGRDLLGYASFADRDQGLDLA